MRDVRLLFFALAFVATGCGEEPSHDECPATDSPAFDSFEVAPDSVEAGGTVDVTLTGTDLGFDDGSHEETGATPDAASDGEVGQDDAGSTGDVAQDDATADGDDEHAEEACLGGHVHIYLDDLASNPLAMEETLEFSVVIPEDTAPGEHTLIARLQNQDHTIFEPQVTVETTITVVAP